MRAGANAVVIVEMRERAEHPADGVAQLAVGFDRGLEDFRPDAQVVPVVGRADPQPQNVGAGLLDHVLRRDAVASSDFDILRPCSSSMKPWVSTTSNGARPRVPQDFEQRGMEPAAMLVGAFEIHHGIGAAVALAPDAGEAGKCSGSSSTKACVEPESNQTSRMSSTFSHSLALYSGSRKRARRAGGVPGVGAFLLESIGDALVDALVLEDFDRAVVVLAHEHGDRHAPGALARDHPVGLAHHHAGDAVLAGGRHPARLLDGFERAVAQRVAGLGFAARVLDAACPSR